MTPAERRILNPPIHERMKSAYYAALSDEFRTLPKILEPEHCFIVSLLFYFFRNLRAFVKTTHADRQTDRQTNVRGVLHSCIQ